MAMNAIKQIFSRMADCNTLACCGLDPDLKRMPREITSRTSSDEDKVYDFLRSVVDVTGIHVCAYKAQKAFFDLLPGGHDVLKAIISYIHTSQAGIPIIVDCKIGDIDNTMAAYCEGLFETMQADGVVVNPFMGDDVMMPLTKYPDKAIVTLVKSSNLSGSVVQDVELANGLPFWRHILNLVVNRWNSASNMIPVLGLSIDMDRSVLRSLIPESMLIWCAGFGAQGGGCAGLRRFLNSEGLGVCVGSSRNVLYSKHDDDWLLGVESSIIQLKAALNGERGSL